MAKDAYQEHVERLRKKMAEQPEIVARPRLTETEAQLVSDLIERTRKQFTPAVSTVLGSAQAKIDGALVDAIEEAKTPR